MKKFILAMIGLLCLGIGSAFAETKTKVFIESGSYEINYKSFWSVEVKNYSGTSIYANNQYIGNGSKWTLWDDYVIIKTDFYWSNDVKTYWEVKSGKLYITLIKD